MTSASATSRLRRWGYAAILTALAFAQSPGRIVPDTKFDLVAAPWRFLANATQLWDAEAAFGQIQNQAYGYLWPMGPFFGLGKLIALPEWVIQRLWWALLLNLAFFGILRLLRELRLGTPWSQVAAATAFVLAPRITSILGESSVELWPTALAPWVLVPLIRGSERGSVVKAAAAAALLVACCGGVNATAASAVIPIGVIWLLTRAPGPRRWRLLGWWGIFTVAATLWWTIPLMLLGRYAAPFLDYIENATLTSSVTDPSNSLLGTSNWAPYLGGGSYPAGTTVLGTPFVLLDAAAIAGLGLAGLALRAHPQRRFGIGLLLAGLVLVGLGYVGQVHGWGAAERQSWLDGALAALRNTHKYDVAIRLALSLGIAHALARPLQGRQMTPAVATLARRMLVGTTAVVLVGLALPWAQGSVAAPGGFTAVPTYWRQAADAAGSRTGTSLVVPAAAFDDYTWGSTRDGILQPYATGPWAVRNVVPLAEPGNVDLLDQVTALLESGHGSDQLAGLLARAGVGTLVVRNDLDRAATGAPDPAYVHAALENSPGLTRVAGYGDKVGQTRLQTGSDGARVVVNRGLAGQYSAVELYAVSAPATATLQQRGTSVMGDVGSGLPLTADLLGTSASATATGGATSAPVVLTDGMRRREVAFQAVRRNVAATDAAGSSPLRPGREQFHRVIADQEAWQTTLAWQGVSAVTATSSQAAVDAEPPLDRGATPGSALDGDDTTAWKSAAGTATDGQRLTVTFDQPTDVDRVTLRLPSGLSTVTSVDLRAGAASTRVDAPAAGTDLPVTLRATAATSLSVTLHTAPGAVGQVGIAELTVPGLSAHRVLALPTPPTGVNVEAIDLTRDRGTSACPLIDEAVTCLAYLGTNGEDGDHLDRSLTTDAGEYRLSGTASLRRDPSGSRALAAAAGVDLRTTGSAAVDLAESPVAMIDGDPATTWRAEEDASVTLRFDTPRVLHSLTLATGSTAAARSPERVEIRAGAHRLRVTLHDGDARLPGWRTDHLTIRVLTWSKGLSIDDGQPATLDPGISELLINGEQVGGSQATLGCAAGPRIDVDGTVVATRLTGSLSALVRGDDVALEPCGDAVRRLGAGTTTVLATPSDLARVDTLHLTALAQAQPQSQTQDSDATTGVTTDRALTGTTLPVTRDGRDTPTSVQIAVATTDERVLSLPQNFNAAWRATLDGTVLTPLRVDGWQQGWVVPAGLAGTVSLDMPANTVYRVGLVLGALGVLGVAVVLVRSRPRRELAPLGTGEPTYVDSVLAVLALGLLAGWIGAALGLVLIVAGRRLPGLREGEPWGPLAAGAVLVSVLPRVLERGSDLAGLAQWSAVVAVALIAGSLRASGPRFFSRSTGDSRNR
ncbi:alpha-(1-_3)-arabinofuranosyltransferase family protein [Nocardioides sp.]|uniref:alpha-(1->3)-arabinofuranosyltransferase domain-containing protein n=1 Tax=Nocardioides sp. TaxID=35761 RepID=UPI0026088D80|nr:alpha-(1->3)-arabinofuranosyltransferase family protein [Nocardioides sp.]